MSISPHEFEDSTPQGLKAKKLAPLMSGLKPRPTQPRSSHADFSPCGSSSEANTLGEPRF
jgi:hypothetical protein